MNFKDEKRLLIVEDEIIIALHHKTSLEKLGYNVVVANSGEKALKIFSTNQNFDLILMDIDLGEGLDGPDVAVLLLKERDIPVLFLSSHTESHVVARTEKITSYGYVVKNSGISVINASIKMAFKLFESKKLNIKNKYIETIMNTSPDGFLVIDDKKNIHYANETYCRMTGYSKEELLKLYVNDIDVEKKTEEVDDLFQHVVDHGFAVFETKHRRKNDSSFDVMISASLFDYDGVNLICFCRDITQQKQKELEIKSLLFEKELILKEVHHRMKNNMNTLRGICFLQADNLSGSSAASSLHDTAGRINSMMMLYDKLYCSHDYREISVKSYIEPLISEIISNFPNSSIVKVEKNIGDFYLSSKLLFPLGIILNEIITNTMKYAFDGISYGLINISVLLSEQTVEMIIGDNGIGVPDSINFQNSTGFGMQLVNLFTNQLGGSINIDRVDGTKFILRFDI